VHNPAKDDLFIPWGIHEQLSKNSKNLDEVINGRRANRQHRFPVAASMADDEASISKVVGMADRIVPGHFPELKPAGSWAHLNSH
jgi:hypothetical protein